MFYTLAAAAKATGLSEATILKAVEDGGVTATRDLFGDWQIDRDELHRSYAPIAQCNAGSEAAQSDTSSEAADLEADIEALIAAAGHTLRQRPDHARRDRDSGRGIVSLVPVVSAGQSGTAAQLSPAMHRPRRGVGLRARQMDRIGISAPERTWAWDHVRAPLDGEVLVPSVTPGTKRLRVALAAAGLLAALGLGWLSGREFNPVPASQVASAPLPQNLNASARVPGQEADITSSIPAKAERQATPSTPNGRKIVSQQNSTLPARELSAAQPTKNLPRPTPVPETRLTTPVPETRPTTIEGWTVREVVGGRVVLEGPNGTWSAARGETVPGVGRVDSIVLWGNRWIVATSRGLISTQ
jgi:hypothetical protein